VKRDVCLRANCLRFSGADATSLVYPGAMGIALGVARSARGRAAEVLVEVFSVPDDFQRHLPLGTRLKLGELGVLRLGSALTDARGEFRIEFGVTEAREAGREKPVNLWLIGSVTGKEGATKLVHQEPDVRRHAGHVESFIVVVPEADLPAPPQPEPRVSGDDVRRDFKVAQERTAAFTDASKPTYVRRASTRKSFAKHVAPGLLAEISTVSRDRDGKPVDPDYVSPGAPLREQLDLRMTEALRGRFENDAPDPLVMPGRISLTDEQLAKAKEQGAVDGEVLAIDEEKLHAILRESGGLNPSLDEASMSRVEVVQQYCRERSKAEKCLLDGDTEHDHGENGTGGTTSPNGGSSTPPPPPFDDVSATTLRDQIPGFVSYLLNEQSILDQGLAGLKRPGEQLTEQQIRAQARFPGLSLPPGPADGPALYDFDKLQIAFKPLWSEALDDKLLIDAEAAFDRYVELGGDPSAIDGTTGWLGFSRDVEMVFTIPLPASVVSEFEITAEEWNVLAPDHRSALTSLAGSIATLQTDLLHREKLDDDGMWLTDGLDSTEAPLYNTLVRYVETRTAVYRGQGARIVRFARQQLERRTASRAVVPPHRILTELKTRALSQYPVRYFAANRKECSVNFGLMITYRQTWTPTAYQVGELIQSIPLAPGESRRYSKKTTRKEKRSQKEIRSNLSAQKSDTKSTTRAEAEIVQRAQQKTNYQATVDGSFKIGIADVKGSNTITADAQADSSETKKSLHEAVVAAAREYKEELKVELETEQTFETEQTESGELSNPNQELTVTYLLYELQRRFRVSERLHRLRSVVLVAQEMPQPSEIDEDWLINHRWILNRVLLDDSFRAPLVYVAEGMAAEEHALTELKRALSQQSRLVEELKGQVRESREASDARYGALQASMERSARATQRSSDDGGLFSLAKQLTSIPVLESLAGRLIGADGEEPETARVREAASRDAYERELDKLRDLESRLAHEGNTLATMTRAYADRLSTHLGHVVRVAELQAHVKDNIIHYMQAIWLHEPPDQRFMRLKDVPVPDLQAVTRKVNIHVTAVAGALGAVPHTTAKMYAFQARCGTQPVGGTMKTRPLIEVADVDALLGFKANYMIFALKKPNPLTRFMMQPYVEQAAQGFGITDPDDLGNISLDEFGEYVCCLKKHLDRDEFAKIEDKLKAQLTTLLQAPVRDDEEIVVPLDAMYIEALPGSKPLLENFKLLHRQIDAADAQENLRLKKMEKLRYAQRLLDGELRDPDATASYVFEGAPGVVVTPPAPGGGGGPGGPPP
jgi:hypothetical protein